MLVLTLYVQTGSFGHCCLYEASCVLGILLSLPPSLSPGGTYMSLQVTFTLPVQALPVDSGVLNSSPRYLHSKQAPCLLSHPPNSMSFIFEIFSVSL